MESLTYRSADGEEIVEERERIDYDKECECFHFFVETDDGSTVKIRVPRENVVEHAMPVPDQGTPQIS